MIKKIIGLNTHGFEFILLEADLRPVNHEHEISQSRNVLEILKYFIRHTNSMPHVNNLLSQISEQIPSYHILSAQQTLAALKKHLDSCKDSYSKHAYTYVTFGNLNRHFEQIENLTSELAIIYPEPQPVRLERPFYGPDHTPLADYEEAMYGFYC